MDNKAPRLQFYNAGSVIVAEGNKSHKFMICVRDGSAAVFCDYGKPEQHRVSLLLPESFYGAEWLYTNDPPDKTIVAMSDVAVLIVSPAAEKTYFEKNPDKMAQIIPQLSLELQVSGEKLRLVRQELAIAKDTISTLTMQLSSAMQDAQNAHNSEAVALAEIQAAQVAAQAAQIANSASQASQVAQILNQPLPSYTYKKEQKPKPPAPKPIPVPKPAPKPAPKPMPVAPVKAEPVEQWDLMPPEYGNMQHELSLCNNTSFVAMREMECPFCNKKFSVLRVRAHKLVADRTDVDTRVRYRDIEPIYYDVVTCPNCFYSAIGDMFNSAMTSRKRRLNELLAHYTQNLEMSFAVNFDTDTAFKGYYLALLCAPVCLIDYELIVASLWLKIYRMYCDCGDAVLSKISGDKAKNAYLEAYSKLNISEEKMAQMNLTIGALSFSVGDLVNARNFLYKAKTGKNNPPVVKDRANILLDEIKEMQHNNTPAEL